MLNADAYGMVVAPRSQTEHAVTALWADIMGTRPPSIDDEFLSVGGELLRAKLLLQLVKERWRVEVSVEEFMTASSIAGLSATVERKVADARTRDSNLLNDALKQLDGWVE